MMLLADDFNDFLHDVGQSVSWRKSYVCPCVNPNSGQPNQACPFCTGKGVLWKDPINSVVGVCGRSTQRSWATFGEWVSGDVLVILPSTSDTYNIGRNDRVAFLNRTEPFSVNLVKGINERIRFPVKSVDEVLYIQGNTIQSATLPMVSDDGILNWSGSNLPDGVTISVTGRRLTEYFCFNDNPFDRPHQQGEPLPRNVVLRRFDLFPIS